MFAYTRLDAVLLERMAGAAHAEVYAGAFRLLDACNMFGYFFASLLLPMFARMLKQKEPVAPLVSLVLVDLGGQHYVVGGHIFCTGRLAAHHDAPAANLYRADVLGVLIWAFVPVSVTYIFSTLLTARERMMRMNRFFLVGIAIDLALNLLLIPYWQAFGSAVAALATQLFIAGAMVWLSIKEFGFRPGRTGLLQVIGFLVFMLCFDFFIFKETNLFWAVKFGLALFAGLVALFLFQAY